MPATKWTGISHGARCPRVGFAFPKGTLRTQETGTIEFDNPTCLVTRDSPKEYLNPYGIIAINSYNLVEDATESTPEEKK